MCLKVHPATDASPDQRLSFRMAAGSHFCSHNQLVVPFDPCESSPVRCVLALLSVDAWRSKHDIEQLCPIKVGRSKLDIARGYCVIDVYNSMQMACNHSI